MNTEEIELFTEFPEILKIYKASDGEYFLRLREVQAYANSIPNDTFIEIPRPNSLPPLPTDPIPINENWVRFPTLWQWKGDFSISGNVQLLPVPSLENRMWVYRIITTAGGSQAKELRWGALESQRLMVGVGDFVMCTSNGWIKIENALRMKELETSVSTMTAQAGTMVANYPNMFSKLSVTLFINQSTGNDNNDGLTEATALKSLLRASIIVKDKFVNVYLKIFGTYTHAIPEIVFSNANVTLSVQSGGLFIFQRRIYAMGAGYQNFECFSPLRFTGNVEIKGEYGSAVLPRIFLESIATFTTTNGLEKYYHDINRCAINVGTADVFNDNNTRTRTFTLKQIKAEIYENATLGAGSGYGQYMFPTPDNNFAKFVEADVTWALTAGAKKVHGFFGSSVLRNCTPTSTSDLGVSEMVYDSNFGYINVGGTVKKFALTNL